MTDMCSFPEIPADTVSKGTSKKSITMMLVVSSKFLNVIDKKEGKCFDDISCIS